MNNRELILKYKDIIDTFTRSFKNHSKDEKFYDILREGYTFFKENSDDFYDYDTNMIRKSYITLLNMFLESASTYAPNEFILPIKKYNLNPMGTLPIDSNEDEAILYFLVNQTREMLNKIALTRGCTLENMDLCGLCSKAMWYSYELAKRYGINSKPMIIEPAFALSSTVYNGNGGGHAYLIVHLRNKRYLIDCTYSQFFLRKLCIKETLGMMCGYNPQPGMYIDYDKKRLEIARKLLDDGWMELTSDNYKAYLDGFVLSWRNGLYYEDTNDFSFKVPYTIEEYEDMLRNEDDLLSHEKKEHLGFQYRPIKNPKMDFHLK